MAVTDIQATVLRITAEIPTANSVEDAQRFIVSSVPKDLLMFAQKASSASTDGSAISFSVNDSITDVQRNGYSCAEIPMSDAAWVLDSSSLRLATAKRPVFYHKQGAVHFAPITDGSNAGYVFYVDFSLIDDSCDLRNAVIYQTSSHEFTKLATGKVTDWSDLVLPVSPTSPDFGSDLTISVNSPVAPESPSFTYTAVSVSDITQPLVSVSDMATATGAPTYLKPIISLGAAPTISDLSITAVAPSTPSLTSVTFASIDSALDTVAPTFTTATVSASSVYTGSAPTYTSPVLSLTTFPTITWSFPSVPVAPSSPSISSPGVSAITIDDLPTAPVYTPPVITTTGSDSTTLDLTKLDTASWTAVDYDFDDENIDPLKWFQLAGDFIQNEEDAELANAQLQKISTYIQAYNAAMQSRLNTFNDQNVDFQAGIQRNLQQAQIDMQDAQKEADLTLQAAIQDYTLELQKFQAEVQTYQSEVSKVVSGNQAEISEWQIRSATDIQKYGSDIQNTVNIFNKENVAYQSAIQESMQEIQVANQVNMAQAQSDLQAATTNKDRDLQRQLQNGTNDMQAIINDNNRKVTLYQAESGQYQANVGAQVQEYQQNLAGDLEVWQAERTTDLQKYGSDIQDALNGFNKENVEYQQDIQKKVQNLQKDLQVAVQNSQNEFTTRKSNLDKDIQIALQNAIQDFQQDVQEYGSKLQKYGAEVGAYQQDMNKEIQDFVNTLQKETQEYQSKVALYNSDLQKYQTEIGEKTAKVGSATQNAAYYSKEADKYYQWANAEVQMYIQNNSKMINQTIAAQAAQQQRR